MTKNLLISTALILALAGCGEKGTNAADDAKTAIVEAAQITLPAGFEKIETVTRKGDEIVIPYSKYVLDNGLTVVLHPDSSDPLVHVDVTYHVGSGREEVGKSGFAHFFEHMMFQGSENVADEQHFKLITESGGTLNGSTNTDRTNYYETIPSISWKEFYGWKLTEWDIFSMRSLRKNLKSTRNCQKRTRSKL